MSPFRPMVQWGLFCSERLQSWDTPCLENDQLTDEAVLDHILALCGCELCCRTCQSPDCGMQFVLVREQDASLATMASDGYGQDMLVPARDHSKTD